MPVFKYADMPVAKMNANVERREAHTENLMITIVDLNGVGSIVDLHHHPHEQITCIAEGKVKFILGEGESQTVTPLEPGDAVVVPPNVPHGVEVLTEHARAIDAFHPIREDFL